MFEHVVYVCFLVVWTFLFHMTIKGTVEERTTKKIIIIQISVVKGAMNVKKGHSSLFFSI